MTFDHLTKERLYCESMEGLTEVNKMLQTMIEKQEFSIVLKQISKGAVATVEKIFDGTRQIPIIGYTPNLTGWKTEANMIIDSSNVMYDSFSEKIIGSGSVGDGIRLTSRLVSSAIACDVLNKYNNNEKLADNINKIESQKGGLTSRG